MKKQAKKKQTIKDQIKRQRIIKWSTFGGEFVSVLTPFIAMGAVYYDEWFKYNPEGWKIGMGGTLALAILGICMALVSKKKEKAIDNQISNGMIALTLSWFAVAFIFFLLADIMNQIATIMFFGGIGLAGACGLNIASLNAEKKEKELMDIMKSAKEQVLKEKAINEYKDSEPVD